MACLLNYEHICYDFTVEYIDDERFKTIIDEELEKNGLVRAVYYYHDLLDNKIETFIQSGDYHIEADTVEMTVYSLITK